MLTTFPALSAFKVTFIKTSNPAICRQKEFMQWSTTFRHGHLGLGHLCAANYAPGLFGTWTLCVGTFRHQR